MAASRKRNRIAIALVGGALLVAAVLAIWRPWTPSNGDARRLAQNWADAINTDDAAKFDKTLCDGSMFARTSAHGLHRMLDVEIVDLDLQSSTSALVVVTLVEEGNPDRWFIRLTGDSNGWCVVGFEFPGVGQIVP